jgi:transposase
VLFVGDDWAEDHHDVEVQDESGRVLTRARLPEGVAGMARLHALIGGQIGEADQVEVLVGIETDRGPWVQALLGAGYQVYAINPLRVAGYRDRRHVSRAKSDSGDAHMLADMIRTDRHELRPVAGDSPQAEAVQIVTRAHKSLIWERTRHLLRLRQALLDFFPNALVAFEDLDARDSLELLNAAPDPVLAAKLSRKRIEAALARAGRHHRAEKAQAIQTALRGEQLHQPDVVNTAYAATVRAQVAILTVLNTQITEMETQVDAHFGRHPDVEIYLSQPGLGAILGARVLAEFGDDTARYADARSRRNYAGTSPITRQSGRKKTVLARHIHNNRLIDALSLQAFAALRASSGARAYYDRLRAHGTGHHAALRQLGNRLVGILHGCLKTRTLYNEAKAWPIHPQDQQQAA